MGKVVNFGEFTEKEGNCFIKQKRRRRYCSEATVALELVYVRGSPHPDNYQI